MVLEEFLKEWNNGSDKVTVHTSGSTGVPKAMLVEKKRMEASARITCDFLGLQPGDTALLCMPLDYIAAKMMVVRSIVRGLKLINIPPAGHPLALGDRSLDTVIHFAAMVPLQVYNSMQVPQEKIRLMQIRNLIIGGGAIDARMEAELKKFPYAVWSTYGMTETLSHIALRRLSGKDADGWYTPFDTVSVSLNADHCLVIDAPLVCADTLTTNDIAEIASDGRRFRIVGRRDNVICSGGIKIQIEDVERALKPHLTMPFIVTKRKDGKFGEIVILLVRSADTASAKAVCEKFLPKYWQPRHIIAVDHIPMTPTGKPARAEAEKMAM